MTQSSSLCTVCCRSFANLFDFPQQPYRSRAFRTLDTFQACTERQGRLQTNDDALHHGLSSGCKFCAELYGATKQWKAQWTIRERARLDGRSGRIESYQSGEFAADALEEKSLFDGSLTTFQIQSTVGPSTGISPYIFELNVYLLYQNWQYLFSLNVMAEAGDPAAEFIKAEPLYLDLQDGKNFARAKTWIDDCLHNHYVDERPRSCPVYTVPELPRRVIDVGYDEQALRPKVLANSHQRASYLALSYCWGGPQALTATTENITKLETEGFEITSAPKTIRDAITVARKLGQRYLWVDALCILQDSGEDKAIEVSNMHNIYQNALVTIYASSSPACTEGFLKDYTNAFPKWMIVSVTLPTGTPGTIVLRRRLELLHHQSPLDTRGWAYQEYCLSPRVLIFDKFLLWDCQLRNWTPPRCEEAYFRRSRRPEAQQLAASAQSKSVHELRDGRLHFNQEISSRQRNWAAIVEQYTERSLSDSRDRLPAIAAMAAVMAQRHLGRNDSTQYLAGLWRETLIVDLLWSIWRRAPHDSVEERAPSWSWATVDGEVHMTRLEDVYGDTGSLHTYADITACKVVSAFEGAEYGEVRSGLLQVKGILFPVRYFNTERFDILNDKLDYFEAVENMTASVTSRILIIRATLDSQSLSAHVRQQNFKASNSEISDVVRSSECQPRFFALPLVANEQKIYGLIVEPHSSSKYRRVGYFDTYLDSDIAAEMPAGRPSEWNTWMVDFKPRLIEIV